MERIRRHHISLRHAVNGVKWAFHTQPNFQMHGLLSAAALLLGWFLEISRVEMIIVLLTIVVGLSVEMANTSIETVTDLVTKEWREEAKTAKDVAAGMMLVTATGAVLVASSIFFPHLIRWFGM